MPVYTIKNSFNAGELSPMIDGRTDLSKYYNGCSELVNATATPYGGIVKRSGSIFVAKTKVFTEWAVDMIYTVGCVVYHEDKLYYCETAHTASDWTTDLAASKWSEIESKDGDSSKVKLFSFEFSTTDTHILEFGTRYMRVYKNNSRVYETAQNLDGITLTDEEPVHINVDGHGYVTGDTVKFENINGTDELNNKEYVVSYVDADNFDLYGTEFDAGADNYTAYSSAGTVKRVYEIITPYSSQEAFEIHKAQSADIFYIAHEDYWPRQIARYDDDDWRLTECDFVSPPFLTENVDDDKLLTFAVSSKLYGTHDGGSETLTDASQNWTADELIGLVIYNTTDGSHGTITDNDAHTITVASLSGGSDNSWDTNDAYTIAHYGYYFEKGCFGTLTATGATPFLSSHVDSYWQLKHTRQDNTASRTTAGDSSAVKVRGDFNVHAEGFATDQSESITIKRKEGNGSWQDYYVAHSAIDYSSTETGKEVYYKFTIVGTLTVGKLVAQNQTNYGIVKITAYSNTSTVSCEVVEPVYRAGGTGTSSGETALWSEGAWSEYRGFPRTVSFYEDRLYWASSTYNPQTLWGSVVGEYLNHEIGDTDADALILPLNANDISQIQWIAARQSMVVGTASAEFVLSASNPDDPMTATDKKARPTSNFGSNNMQPLVLNNGLFYFQRQGRKLQVMTYAYEIDTFKSENATMLASHILENSPVSAAVQLIPDSIMWVVLDDGTLAAFCYEPAEQVFAAWSRCVTGSTGLTPVGAYESVAVVRGTVEDEVWTSVKRTITVDSVEYNYRYVEYFAPRLIQAEDEGFYSDSCVYVNTGYDASDVVLAQDTILCNEGLCNNGLCGGVIS